MSLLDQSRAYHAARGPCILDSDKHDSAMVSAATAAGCGFLDWSINKIMVPPAAGCGFLDWLIDKHDSIMVPTAAGSVD